MTRLIYKSGSQTYNDVSDLLQAVFISELLQPSRELWLSSAWISDIPVIDNRSGDFATVVPDWPASKILLADVLAAIANRGCEVRVMTRPDEFGRRFVQRFADAGLRHNCLQAFHARYLVNLHGKGLLSSRCYLSGSMNITHNGVQVNDEDLRFDTDPSVLGEASLAFQHRWDRAPTGDGALA